MEQSVSRGETTSVQVNSVVFGTFEPIIEATLAKLIDENINARPVSKASSKRT